MAIASRLKRLETVMAPTGKRRTFDDFLADLHADEKTVWLWLREHGYNNALEAIAAGETGPQLRLNWTLETLAGIERDIVTENVYSWNPENPRLWFSRKRKEWCIPLNGRLEYLGSDYYAAAARYRRLTAQ